MPCSKTTIILRSLSSHARPTASSPRAPLLLPPRSTATTKRHKSSFSNDDGPPPLQAKPLTGFYLDILNHSRRSNALASARALAPAPAPAQPATLFGPLVPDAATRRAEIDASSRRVAGVLVPARPVEPDNCCMSGCVNCVWDLYREELEEWAAKSREARASAAAAVGGDQEEEEREGKGKGKGNGVGPGEERWIAGGKEQEEELDDLPVGIREFMKAEKMLKERRAREREMEMERDKGTEGMAG